MKTIGRILVILTAALLVASGTYALGHSNWVQQNFAGGRGDFRGRDGFGDGGGRLQLPPTFEDNRFERDGFGGQEGFPRDGGRLGSPFSLGSLFEFARTLVPIALVTIIVAFLMRRSKSTETAVEP